MHFEVSQVLPALAAFFMNNQEGARLISVMSEATGCMWEIYLVIVSAPNMSVVWLTDCTLCDGENSLS